MLKKTIETGVGGERSSSKWCRICSPINIDDFRFGFVWSREIVMKLRFDFMIQNGELSLDFNDSDQVALIPKSELFGHFG